jgi:hypothetical protein
MREELVKESLRYLGAKGDDQTTIATVQRMLGWLDENKKTDAVFGRFKCKSSGDIILLGGMHELKSTSLAAHLKGCTEVALFAATLGASIDREMARLSSKSLYEAAVFDACANAVIEEVCDERCLAFAEALREENLHTTSRFSPGYGDLLIETQRLIFALLRPEKRIGITLSGALTLIPTKSVTAFIGISPLPCGGKNTGCAECSSRETCPYRRT